MDIIELCHNCGSVNTDEAKPNSIATELLGVVGYHSLCCKNCGFNWRQFFPLSTLLNLIYLFLAMEIGFLLLNYMY